jgi:hypothetical protein
MNPTPLFSTAGDSIGTFDRDEAIELGCCHHSNGYEGLYRLADGRFVMLNNYLVSYANGGLEIDRYAVVLSWCDLEIRNWVARYHPERLDLLPTTSSSPAPRRQIRTTLPRWNADLRELRYGSVLCRKYTRKAPEQERLLAAFEDAGWPPRIASDSQSSNELRQLVYTLNEGLRKNDSPIEFSGDGSGHGVLWAKIFPLESEF